MKKLLVEYSNIVAYTIVGIIFGLAFFLLFINLYHFKDVNKEYVKQDSDYAINDELKRKLDGISVNINSISLNSADPNYAYFSNLQSRLAICTEKINTEKLDKLLQKSTISTKDIYDMQQFYKIDIANECLVKELYGLTDNPSFNNFPTYQLIIPFIEDNINELKSSTDYVEKILKNNSSYAFTSTSTRNDIYDQVEDSYYELLNNYSNAIDFIYDVSVWYVSIAGGNI